MYLPVERPQNQGWRKVEKDLQGPALRKARENSHTIADGHRNSFVGVSHAVKTGLWQSARRDFVMFVGSVSCNRPPHGMKGQ